MIEVTLFGVAFAPLLVWTLGRPDRLAALVIFGSIFDAATVMNLNLGSFSFGVQPAFAADLGLIVAVGLRLLAGQSMGGGKRALYVFWPFVLFLALAALSSVLLPKLLAGHVYVWPQRAEQGVLFPSPLAFTPGNITQTGYLLVGGIMAVFACVWMEGRAGSAERLVNVYLLSGTLAALIGLWQWLNRTAGIWFPHDFLFTNPAWADLADEMMGSLDRISGSFNEPSFFCFYLSGVIYAALWQMISTGPTLIATTAFCTCLGVAVMSTSTTAYAAIGLGLPLLALFAARTRGAYARLGVWTVAAIPAALLAAFLVWHFLPGLVHAGNDVARDTLNKTASESYEIRSRQDHDSFALVYQTLGFGAGWGSVRASSLIATVVGATGVWGPALLAWFALRVGRNWRKGRDAGGPSRPALEAFAASVIGMAIAAAVSKPDLTFSGFWINLAAATAAALQARRLAPAPAPAPEPRPVPAWAPGEAGRRA